MFGSDIPKPTEKDVGVLISDTLRPSRHCAEIARKASAILYQISRSFHYRDKYIFVKLYKTYVRCLVDYASPCWSPWTAHDTETLEKVQKQFVSLIPGLQGSYEEKLVKVILGQQSLKARRRRADMIKTFKILRGFDNVDSQDWSTTYGANARVRRTAS